jgi:hypothetical protein
MNKMLKKDEDKPVTRSNKPVYCAPDIESEDIFERRALACGKCRSGPHMQFACMRLPSVS